MNTASLSPPGAAWPPAFWLSVFVPFGAAYLVSFGLRSVNAAIAPSLIAEFSLDAATLGLLTAAYFLSFSFTQLPLGGWLDRFRPRRVNAMLLVLCAAGCFVFAGAKNAEMLVAGRILIGIGVAACLMASLRTFGLWLAPVQLPAVNGYMLAVGNAGAIASTAPVSWLLGFITWSQMFVGIGLAALGIATWLAFRVPDPPAVAPSPTAPATAAKGASGSSWRLVLGHRTFWLLIPIACLTNAIGLAVQGLWAGPWLVDVAGIERSRIGHYLLLVPAGMLAANLILGRALTGYVNRGGSAIRFAAWACLAAPLGQLPFIASWASVPAPVMLVFGLTHVFGNLAFAALAPQFPREVAGRLVTTINFIMFFGSFLLQWGMGLVINRFPAESAGRYHPAGYETAFLLLMLLQAAAAVWTLIALAKLPRADTPAPRS